MTTQTKPLGVAEVRELLVRAVEEKGADYVYSPSGEDPDSGACLYFRKDGAPSCIAGHVFDYAGVDRSRVIEGQNAWALAELLTSDQAVRKGLDAAQDAQDGGKTWGEALAAFDEAVQS